MSATNVYRSTTPIDYLNDLRQPLDATLAGSGVQTNWVANYILQISNVCNLTDSLFAPVTGTPGGYTVNDDHAYQTFYFTFNYLILDGSGNARDATVVGNKNFSLKAIVVPFQEPNQSFQFDGLTYVTVPSSASISGTGDRTLSLWLNPSSFVDGARIFEYGAAGTRTLFSLEYSGTSGQIKFYDGTNTQTSTAALSKGNWNWIGLTIGTSGTAFKLYINSTTADTSATITALNTTASTISLGADITGANLLPNNTLLDEIQMYNVVASSAELTSFYNGQPIAHNPTITKPTFVGFADLSA